MIGTACSSLKNLQYDKKSKLSQNVHMFFTETKEYTIEEKYVCTWNNKVKKVDILYLYLVLLQ